VSENTKETQETSDDSEKYYVSHVIGISRPEDELGPVNPVGSVDEASLQDGVEPDWAPGLGIFVGFGVLTLSLVLIGAGVAQWVFWMSKTTSEARTVVDARLTEVREVAASYLQNYAVNEASGSSATSYRVPVEVAFDILEANPTLLAAHPLGVASNRMDAPGRASSGAAIGQDWAAISLDPVPVLTVDPALEAAAAEGSALAALVAAEGSAAALQIDPITGLLVAPVAPTDGSAAMVNEGSSALDGVAVPAAEGSSLPR
jgi:hypothetical protein